MIELVQAGMRSLSGTIRSDGYDPGEVFDELEADKKELDRRGLVVTSDGRNAAKQAQEPVSAPEPKKKSEEEPEVQPEAA
jgi:capsid protein